MILGIGIDSVEIERFKPWVSYPKNQLLRIFSEHEIDYSLSNPKKASERLAARFTAKEAFFKAFAQAAPENGIPFLTICSLVSVESAQNNAPKLRVYWPELIGTKKNSLDRSPLCWLSITHTISQATAMVLLENST